MLTGFQESQHWHAERVRYEALAAGKQHSVAMFSQGQLGRATAVRRFKLDRNHPLDQEWFLFVLTDRFSAALFGRELPDQDPDEGMDLLFASVWTFDPTVIGDLLQALQDVAATASEQTVTLASIDDADERARLAGIIEREALRAGRITRALLTFVSRRDLILRLEDDGQGVPTALAARAFTPFVTTKPAGSAEGPGHAPSGSWQVPPVAPTHGHVLLVGDEPAIRGLLESLLRRDGWDVTSVEGPTEALDAARGTSFDLALLDVGDDGRRLLRELEEQQPGLWSRSTFTSGSSPPNGALDGRPGLGKRFAWQDPSTMLAEIVTQKDAASPT